MRVYLLQSSANYFKRKRAMEITLLSLFFVVMGLSVECVLGQLQIDRAVQHYDISIVRNVRRVGKWTAERIREPQTSVDICTLNSLQRDRLCTNLLANDIDTSYDYSKWKAPMQYAFGPTLNGRQIMTGAIQCLMDPPIFVYGRIDDQYPQLSRITIVMKANDVPAIGRKLVTNDRRSSKLSRFLTRKKPQYLERQTRNSFPKAHNSRYSVK